MSQYNIEELRGKRGLSMKVKVKSYGTHDEIEYSEIFIEKEDEFIITFSDLGARINRWLVKSNTDSKKYESIILGNKNAPQAFEHAGYYYGATIGRVAGRIDKGKINIDGQNYQLALNDDANHLHGGNQGFDLVKWDYKIKEMSDKVEVIFTYIDPDGSNNYPGELAVSIIHQVSHDGEWTVCYRAKTDKPTLFNPTNHVYFNLNGDNRYPIINHKLQVEADFYLKLRSDNIPTGELIPVDDSPFDLRDGMIFRDLLKTKDPQFKLHDGFDHPFVLNPGKEEKMCVYCPETQRLLVMKTDRPAVVIYTQNYYEDIEVWGSPLVKYSGFTAETQNEPDAVNHSNFHSIILRPGEIYESTTSYRLFENVSEWDGIRLY